MLRKKYKPRVISAEKCKFPWAYVDGLRGKLELVSTKNIFRVDKRQKLPFVPQHESDFDASEKHVEVVKTATTTESRTVYVKLLAGNYFFKSFMKILNYTLLLIF